MTNQEAIDELQYAIDLIKQDGKDWLGKRDIPILEAAISALEAQEELYVDSKCKTCRYYHDYDDVRCMICDDENDMYEEKESKHSTESSLTQKALDTISRQAAIDAAIEAADDWDGGYNLTRGNMIEEAIKKLPSVQPEPEWGLPVSINRPLSDREIIPRLREIQRQIGGSYAIDRAIELIKALAERRTDEPDKQTD